MGTFNIAQRIDVREKCANIDALYGPYENIEAALAAIPSNRRVIGRTVAILNNGTAIEYWWKSGIEDSDLVQKVEQMTLSLYIVGDSEFTKEEGDTIFGQFRVDGGAGVKKAVLYQMVDGNEMFVQEYGNIAKGSPYSFLIPNPAMSGTYRYHIKVIDSLDNYAITTLGLNYLEYTLHYGGISTIYNLTELNAITVKNFVSVADIPFQLNISVRDNTFQIQSVCITDMTDEDPAGLSAPLTPSSGNYLGTNTYYMPNSDVLEAFNGKRCSVVVNYTEGVIAKESVKDFFRILDIATLDIVPEYEGGDYYATLPGYYTFQLQSAVENISVLIRPGNNSDFNFEPSTILTYRRFSLKVIPDDIVKNNAQIVMDYSYRYNNVDYTGTIVRTIGNILALPAQSYYEPEEGTTVSRDVLIYADNTDYTGIDDGQYYKVISESVSSSQISSSFILDAYCKINQKNDKNIKYITISYGGIEIASVTEDEISTGWGGLYTDTPLNEWFQLGIGINLQEEFTRGDASTTGYYHCIYINGMLVKTVPIDSSSHPLYFDATSNLVITIGEEILVQKCFLYYKNNGENVIYPNTTTGESIIYNNYKSHKFNFSEPANLPEMQLMKITDSALITDYFNRINAYKTLYGGDEIVHITTFGNIGLQKAITMAEYDPNYESAVIESNATLFRQNVDIKKPAQKEYAVLCQMKWMNNTYPDVIVEVHTQGTSTLVYPVPNFKFTFWKLQGDGVVKYYPEFIQKSGSEDYYQENVYTAKADFMDSSHLNNTPTCTYYNALIQNLISGTAGDPAPFVGSPSARNGMLDAIVGFPIVLQISDTASSFGDIFTNIGSFMLNIDKTGDSLGFEVEERGQQLKCISFEGTSNDNEHGAAGRFDIPEGTVLKDYTDGGTLTQQEIEEEITSDYNFVQSNIIGQKGPNDYVVYNGQTILAKEQPYVAWCIFLSDGLEYRYPDSDMYKEKNGKISKVMKLSDFIKLYTMWWWVYKSDDPNLSQSDYKTGFAQHFDVDYCKLYFINLMIYAQTDNLGKNAMFDYWSNNSSGEKWYPRPYDLDSEAGLDNNGNDNVAPFVEIKPIFSLNYDPARATDYDWLAQNYLIDDEMSNQIYEETGLYYPASTIQYGAQTYERYHFSSNNSKLWTNFYKNFKTEINAFYANLRNNFGYSPETIISTYNSMLIDKLGINQYNQDFRNKYLATEYQRLGYGNRWYKFKKWLTKRFAFCDSYFGATESAMYNLVSRINYTINVDAPQYVAQQYQGEANRDTRFVLDSVSFSAGSGAATIITLLVNQPSVFETSLFKYVTLGNGSTNYKNLISLDVSGNTNPGFTNITTVTGNDLNNLKYLNISNSAVKTLDVPVNVKTLLAENVTLTSLTFPANCAVEEISLKGSTILGGISFSSLPNLKRLDLTDCVFSGSVSFAILPQLEELILTRAIFQGIIDISDDVSITSFDFSNLNLNTISFSGSHLHIDTINFHNTKFSNTILNVNAIRKNIKNLYFDDCQGLQYIQITDWGKFGDEFNCLSLKGSSIVALGNDSTKFDGFHFNNISNLKRVATYLENGNVTYTSFNFRDTKIQEIINLSWNGTGVDLFRDCGHLTSVGGTLSLTSSIDYLCYRCYNLATLPTVTISSSVTTAQNAFAGANSLDYNTVSSIIASCTHVSDFSGTLRCKQFADGQQVNLNTLFGNNVASTIKLDSFMSQYTNGSTYRATSNKIVLTGQIKSTVTTATWMFYGFTTISVPYDLLVNASLQSAAAMFALSTVTFTGNGRPEVTDSHDVQVTLTNAVTKTFFPSNLTGLKNISQMFFNSNVITTDPTLFANLSALENTNATFASSADKAFSFVNSASQTENYDLFVDAMWVSNPAINNISGCFSGRYNVYCNNLNFHQDITASRTINISGLFGINSSANRNVTSISIDLDSIVPILTTDNAISIPTSTIYRGLFQNRSVTINTVPVNGEIFGKLSSRCRSMFAGAVLYIPSSATTFNLSNVSSECDSMFEGCRLYTTSAEPGHAYGIQDRKFVNVTMPTSCSLYSKMFKDSSVLASLPALRSSIASNLSYMYAGCVINAADLELPSNYFEICASQLSNVSYMFQNNKYITTLEYSASRGLFSECVNLSNVRNMFESASFLHKGIPVNIFGTTELPRLINLSYMFAYTSIIYHLEDDSNKWINAQTFAPLVNLDSVEGMFYRCKINGSSSYPDYTSVLTQTVTNNGITVAIIDPATFSEKVIRNISKIFEHTRLNPPISVGTFRFLGFTIAKDAFFSCAIANINDPFVDSNYVSSIVNADRMFYQDPTHGPLYGGNVNNLSNFVNILISYPNISKNNIAGNLTNSGIPSPYIDATVGGDANTYSGFVLVGQNDADAESSWSNYGRHIYAQS